MPEQGQQSRSGDGDQGQPRVQRLPDKSAVTPLMPPVCSPRFLHGTSLHSCVLLAFLGIPTRTEFPQENLPNFSLFLHFTLTGCLLYLNQLGYKPIPPLGCQSREGSHSSLLAHKKGCSQLPYLGVLLPYCYRALSRSDSSSPSDDFHVHQMHQGEIWLEKVGGPGLQRGPCYSGNLL